MLKRSRFGTTNALSSSSELRTAGKRDSSKPPNPSRRPQCGSSPKTLPMQSLRVNGVHARRAQGDVQFALIISKPPFKLQWDECLSPRARSYRRCEAARFFVSFRAKRRNPDLFSDSFACTWGWRSRIAPNPNFRDTFLRSSLRALLRVSSLRSE